jgi:guanylate kinase
MSAVVRLLKRSFFRPSSFSSSLTTRAIHPTTRGARRYRYVVGTDFPKMVEKRKKEKGKRKKEKGESKKLNDAKSLK